MPDDVVVQGRMADGKIDLTPESRTYMAETVRRWPDGCALSVTVARVRARISDLQRGYWFGVVVPLVAEYTGDDEDAVHDDLMAQYGPRVTKRWRNTKTGRRKQRIHRPSLMSLSSREMTELIERVRRDFGNQGVEIPEPDPAWRAKRRAQANAPAA
jgi:hypothetical protein